MADKQTVKIFIASSAEVKDEREKCVLLLNRLNKSHKHLDLEPIEWEYDLVHANYPEYETIQDAINPLLKESDLVIFIFYSKIGANTLKEFNYATAEKKRVFLYFKTGFVSDLDTWPAYEELLRFKKSLSNAVLKKSYKDLVEFEKELYPNLNLYLVERYPIPQTNTESNKPLSADNLALINSLREKDEEIKKLNEALRQLPDATVKEQVQQLVRDKEAIQQQLLQSEEIIRQQAADKKALEQQLSLQIESSDLKAKALTEVEQGNYEEAKEYLKESAKESIDKTASTFYELAKIEKLQFHYEAAYHYYALAAKVNAENSLYLLDAGEMADVLGFYDEAIHYYKALIDTTLKTTKTENADIAVYYNNIGLVYEKNGARDKAIDYFEKAIKIGVAAYGEMHPYIGTYYNSLGMAFSNKGMYDEAIKYLEKAFAITKEAYGEEHPNIANRYNNLGEAYRKKGAYDEAINYQEKALVINNKFLSKLHPNIATNYNNLGLAYSGKGAYTKAIDYFQQALALLQQVFPTNHPSIKTVLENLNTAKEEAAKQNNS